MTMFISVSKCLPFGTPIFPVSAPTEFEGVPFGTSAFMKWMSSTSDMRKI